MSKARESFNRVKNKELFNGETDQYETVFEIDDKDIECLNELVTRDEAKPISHLHPLKSFGKCHVCNKSVHLIHHRNFCGECGTRLIWGGKEVI